MWGENPPENCRCFILCGDELALAIFVIPPETRVNNCHYQDVIPVSVVGPF